jgi:hypothetical protein
MNAKLPFLTTFVLTTAGLTAQERPLAVYISADMEGVAALSATIPSDGV